MINLTSSQLRLAADLQDQIEALNHELAGLLGKQSQAPAAVQALKLAPPAKSGKRTMSPEHKAKIRAAQALRWAKHNAAKTKTEAPEAATEAAKPAKRGPKKGGMSAAGRAAIAAAQKARWAKAKAGKNEAVVEKKAVAQPAKKRKMSPAARAAIGAAAKARWAKVKAAKK